MSSEPMTEYANALQDVRNATDKIESWIKTIHDGMTKLGNWRNVHFFNVSNVGWTAKQMSGPGIDGNAWPGAHELAEGLVSYHQAVDAAHSAYERIPDSQRAAAQPPPPR